MSVFEKRVARELRFDPSRFMPLVFSEARVGWLRPAFAARLKEFPNVFQFTDKEVRLTSPELLSSVTRELEKVNLIPGWRNELYRIEGQFDIERAAARPFGLTTHAVHVNGIVPGKGMWIARRSASKPVDPGMLDNLVGGGLTAGLTAEQVLVKEAWEEAGIPPNVASSAKREGTVDILREVPEGVQAETIFVYDLVLPEDFEPKNQDGEVAEFRLFACDDALNEIQQTENLTLDAALVANDYFARQARRA